MTVNGAMRASASGLFAERMRMDVISGNIANANSMETPDKDAYRRKSVVLSDGTNGVQVRQILEDQSELRRESDPNNPLADAEGYVYYSNVNPIREMVDLMTASRSYEANVSAFNASKSMLRAALNIGKI